MKKGSNHKSTSLTNKDKLYFENIGVNTKNKQFKRFLNAGLLEIKDEQFALEVRKYWKDNYNKDIDPTLHLAFMNLTGNKDTRIVPSPEMWNEIVPFFNDMNIRIGYSDKNIYDKLINPSNSVDTVLKRIRGHYFDSENNIIDVTNVYSLLLNIQDDLIIKPSDNDNGIGIAKLKYNNNQLYLDNNLATICDLEKIYGFNFIVQKVIKQHPVMAAPHPSSVNTLRLITLRWKNEIKFLLGFARFGANNDIKDHTHSGGVALGFSDSGEFMDYTIDANCFVHTHHPTTNYDFTNKAQIPNFEKIKKYIIGLHKKILHHDYVSWDIAVGIDGEPIFIEANFRGPSWRYQLASQKPLFGDMTEEILQYVSKELAENKFDRNVKSQMPKKLLKKKNSKIKKLEYKNNKLAVKLNNAEIKYKELENKLELTEYKYEQSRSWRYTAPFRKLISTFKRG